MNSNNTILLTIDVEDWFQVENFKPWIPFETWDQRELRVERNVHLLLDLFDSFEVSHSAKGIAQRVNDITDSKTAINLDNETNPGDKEDFRRRRIGCSHFRPGNENEQIKNPQNPVNPVRKNKEKLQTTFFILGWIAERLPNLVREIQSRGHEVASHGQNHNPCNQQSHADLQQELADSKKLLEDITGSKVFGFRAPNFSINAEILKVIEACGYLYDSSYNSFELHGRYGQISLNEDSKNGIAHKISENFFELPISNFHLRPPFSYACPVKLFRKKHSAADLTGELSALNSKRNDRNSFFLPWGGGAYFRLMPLPVFMAGLKEILKMEKAYLFYLHPWEFDPKQPKVDKASYFSRFKHYTNIRRTEKKLKKLIKNLSHCQFINCSEYLKQARKL